MFPRCQNPIPGVKIRSPVSKSDPRCQNPIPRCQNPIPDVKALTRVACTQTALVVAFQPFTGHGILGQFSLTFFRLPDVSRAHPLFATRACCHDTMNHLLSLTSPRDRTDRFILLCLHGVILHRAGPTGLLDGSICACFLFLCGLVGFTLLNGLGRIDL